jgi:NAD(P)-dependent dehydrogenase (short-subunit alcohol dehydrogenase family)
VIALVTGGGRGIGANIARKLAEEGWQVVVAASTGAQVEAVADEIGGRASSYSGIISPRSLAQRRMDPLTAPPQRCFRRGRFPRPIRAGRR